MNIIKENTWAEALVIIGICLVIVSVFLHISLNLIPVEYEKAAEEQQLEEICAPYEPASLERYCLVEEEGNRSVN